MKTAEMRALTRNVAYSSRGPATGASGRAQRRRTLVTLTSVRTELTGVLPSGYGHPQSLKLLQRTNFQSADVSLNKTRNRCQLQSCHELQAGEACRDTAALQCSKCYTHITGTLVENILVATLAFTLEESVIHKEPVFKRWQNITVSSTQ